MNGRVEGNPEVDAFSENNLYENDLEVDTSAEEENLWNWDVSKKILLLQKRWMLHWLNQAKLPLPGTCLSYRWGILLKSL